MYELNNPQNTMSGWFYIVSLIAIYIHKVRNRCTYDDCGVYVCSTKMKILNLIKFIHSRTTTTTSTVSSRFLF